MCHTHKWDEKVLEKLPEYIRNEIAYEIGGENNFHLVLPYLKKVVLLLIIITNKYWSLCFYKLDQINIKTIYDN